MFVCATEDVLDVYQRPYDATRPVVCLDEASKQLVKETRPRRPLAPGHPATVDYEYERNGTANLFRTGQPCGGEALGRRKGADPSIVAKKTL